MPQSPDLRVEPASLLQGRQAYRVPRHGAPMDLILDGSASFPPPESLLEGLQALTAKDLSRYPDTSALTQAIASHWSLPQEQVLVTAGVDDAIDRLSRALLSDGGPFLLPTPTFEMLTHYATMAGGKPQRLPWPVGSPYPTQAVLEAITPDIKLIVAISPNNPTGSVIPIEDIGKIAEAAPHAILLLDLAYVEFADFDPTQHALQWPNVVVTRTFSKAWGIPGLRVGYALGHPTMIEWMRTAGEPYAVSAPSLHLARKQLTEHQEHLANHVAQVQKERQSTEAIFSSHGLAVSHSQANFVFAQATDAFWVRDAMAGMGISIRAFPGLEALAGWLRITCPGDTQAQQRLEHALQTTLAPQAMLFDMDGVLVDVSGSYRQAIIETAASYGVQIDGEQIRLAKAAGNANNDWKLTQRLLAQVGVEASLDEVTARFEDLYQGTATREGLRKRETLRVDAAWLSELRKEMPLGIVTGRPWNDAFGFLEEHGIRHLFDSIVCMEDAPAKPHPQPVQLALQQLGVQRAWLLGDTPDDIRASRSAEVLPIGIIAPGEDPQKAIQTLTYAGAARVLQETRELQTLLALRPGHDLPHDTKETAQKEQA
ncbi:MAG: TIGR01548 family HAD-type hydrolase [Myxococcales bacterium]|nr:TIGR01548 family HAD-type hydrolase [Myxococcales bacterium]